jgi:putative colanic acid biosynthesis acetyltransferase WcaF
VTGIDLSSPEDRVPVIDLSRALGRREAWNRPAWQVYLWTVAELLLVTNAWQPSSRLRASVLRLFGARVGAGVVLRPGLRVKFPWKLSVGEHSWIGEGVWIHNQAQLTIGSDAVVSQGSFLTTGSHDFSGDMSLVTRPVTIEDGAWVTARCTVLSGSRVGRSALVLPGTVVRGQVPAGSLYGGHPPAVQGMRFTSSRGGP